MELIHEGSEKGPRVDRAIIEGEVHQRRLLDKQQLRIGKLTFSPGSRTKWHTHACEQVLFITEGRGIVATNSGEQEVAAGDVVFAPPGERHWHGARLDSAMTHISVMGPGATHWEE